MAVVTLASSSDIFDLDGHEILHLSDRTRVVRRRLSADGRLVVCKELLGPAATARHAHERALLDRLNGVPGVVGLVGTAPIPKTLVLEDVGGLSLAGFLKTMPSLAISQKVEMALQLARVVGNLHRLGIVHRDLNPSNVVLSSVLAPTLIDFDLASSMGERPGFLHESTISGTLPYIAPEQTGRTGRAVDERADMYSLGATLYELVTGRPPFEGADPLQLIRLHLARTPVHPIALDDTLPPALSDIVMRLLEKEPDRRYQSADGLAHDLQNLQERMAHHDPRAFTLGEQDFPLRLVAPTRLVARAREAVALREAFDTCLRSSSRGVLVTGPPGVGKTALVCEMRAVVTDHEGWYISGRFDPQGAGAQAVEQAVRALGQLLLAEPEAALNRHRETVLASLGQSAELLAAAVPEFARLFGLATLPSPQDAADTEERLLQAIVGVVCAVASPTRPVVMVIDDLQWAQDKSLKLIERLLAAPPLRGFLLIVTCRDSGVDAAPPVQAVLARWRATQLLPLELHLPNLPPGDVTELVAGMLRLPLARAGELAAALHPLAAGNPSDTVELVNGLRRDQLLRFEHGSWCWNADSVGRYIGQGTVLDLIVRRIEALPPESIQLVEAMACLGPDTDVGLLHAATGLPADIIDKAMRAPQQDGLIVLEQARADASCALRFPHDRVRQAATGRLAPPHDAQRHLALARRLRQHGAFPIHAAEQYRAAAPLVQDVEECRQVAALYQVAGERARLLGNHATETAWLREALQVFAPHQAADPALAAELRFQLHRAHVNEGTLDAADRLYAEMQAMDLDPLALVDVTCNQISSLGNRNLLDQALALGTTLLRRLDLPVDDAVTEAPQAPSTEPPRRPHGARADVTKHEVIAFAKIVNRLIPAAQVCDWMVEGSRHLWRQHGPCAQLVGPVAHAAFVLVPAGDYQGAYDEVRGVLQVSEDLGFEQAAQARFLFSFSAAHWFEPLEQVIQHAERSREELLRLGDLQNACFSYLPELPAVLECSASLDDVAEEMEAALALAQRTGNANAAGTFALQRQLVCELQGRASTTSELADEHFVGGAYLSAAGRDDLFARASLHVTCGLAAALFGNDAGLLHHVGEANRRPTYTQAFYLSALAQLLHALALIWRLPTAGAARQALRSELDPVLAWWNARALDAPSNFAHLALFVRAELARAEDDFKAAALAFDAAMTQARGQHRRWHEAFITERAALFFLASGAGRAGLSLMREARDLYRAWGALGKVRAMEHRHKHLKAPAEMPRSLKGSSSMVSSDAIDLMGVLRASQALSSETSLSRLNARVSELLSAMTGATAVSLALHDEQTQEWALFTAGADERLPQSMPVDEAGSLGLLPLTALRYVDRTREPLLLDDAVADARFSRDPYFSAQPQCSLLVVPIDNQGHRKAILMLENRLAAGAFSLDRLDAVSLVAGQLAVSLDNAQLYASLESKVQERTDALEAANRNLALLSITDPLTGLPNRRRFNEVLRAEWMRALRPGASLALAMIDIDQFKLYNDHYGHQAGDVCLQRVANALKHGVRETADLAARYGGEEFVLVLPGTDLAGAHQTAQRLCAAVAALRLPHELALHGIVTISIGVAAVVPTEGETPEQHLGRADAALYEAKHAGRNQVALSVPPGTAD